MNAITNAMNVVFNNNSSYTGDDQNTMNIDTFADQCLGTTGWWTADGIAFIQLADFSQQMAVSRTLNHCDKLANSMFFLDKAKDEEKVRQFEKQVDEELSAISYWAGRFERQLDIITLEDVVTNIAANVGSKAPTKSNDGEFVKFKSEILREDITATRERENVRAEQEIADKEKWMVNNAKRILAAIKSAWSDDNPVYWNPSDQECRWYFESSETKLKEKLLKAEERFRNAPNDLDRGDESRARQAGFEVLATRAALQSAKDQLAKYPTIAANEAVKERYDEALNQLLAQMH